MSLVGYKSLDQGQFAMRKLILSNSICSEKVDFIEVSFP